MELRSMVRAHQYDITACEFNYALGLVFTGSRDFTVKVWDFQDMKEAGVCLGHAAGGSAHLFLCHAACCLRRRQRVIGWFVCFGVVQRSRALRCSARYPSSRPRTQTAGFTYSLCAEWCRHTGSFLVAEIVVIACSVDATLLRRSVMTALYGLLLSR